MKLAAIGLFTALLAPFAAFAQGAPGEEQRTAERRAAFAAAEKVAVRGAANVDLRDQGQMALPAGYLFVPQPEAGRLMRAPTPIALSGRRW